MNTTLFQNACTIVVNRVLVKDGAFLDNTIDAKLTSYNVRGKYYTFELEIANKRYIAKYTFDSNIFLQGMLEIITETNTETYSVERINDTLRIYTDAFNYDDLIFCECKKLINISHVNGRKESVSCVTLNFKNNTDFTISYVVAYATSCKHLTNDVLRTLFLISGAVEYSVTRCDDVIAYHSTPIDLIIYNGFITQVLCINKHTYLNGKYSGTITLINSEFKQHFEYVDAKDESPMMVFEYEKDQMDKTSKSIKRSYEFAIKDNMIIIPKIGKFTISTIGNDVIFRKK